MIFIDIGFFFVPFYEEGFKIMCKRAYISLHFLNSGALKDYLRKAITEKDLSFLPNKINHQKQFEIFYKEAIK